MNNEQAVDSGSHGLKWGLIIGLTYAALVYLRYRAGANNVMAFSLLTFIGFAIVLVLLFLSGVRLRKDNGGWMEMKELFKALFIAVLLLEFFYMITTYIYLKYIDHNFYEKLRESTENLMLTAKQSQADIDKMLSNMDQLQAQSKNVGILDLLKTYLYYVGITGLFALLFSFILKRKPPVFDQNDFQQS